VRKPLEDVIRQVVTWHPAGMRPRERSRFTWQRETERERKKTVYTGRELEQTTQEGYGRLGSAPSEQTGLSI